jgi:vanillate O-demethylase monooxygenase subunit
VHDGSLGRRDDPVPPIPDVARVQGELQFRYDPPDIEVEDSAMYGSSQYRMPMPLTVSIQFRLASGANRFLWMTASPVDMSTCRAFWWHGRDDDLDGDDEPYIAFQAKVLAEDEPVVCSQDPAPLPLDPAVELSVRTDKVSIEYRRFLRDIADAATRGPAALHALVTGASPSTAVA